MQRLSIAWAGIRLSTVPVASDGFLSAMSIAVFLASTSAKGEMNERANEVKSRFEIPVLIAALLVVPVIIIEEQAASARWLGIASALNWLIWAAFLLEFVSVIAAANDRWAYAKQAWLDVAIILISFPLLPGALGSVRLLRLLRLTRVLRMLRLLRLAAVITRGTQAVQAVFGKRGVGFAMALTLLVALGAGGLFALLEPKDGNFADAMWWAVVTITTVGYGDIAPVTPLGRFAGVVVMVVGIGFVAILTAAISAHFIDSEDTGLASELQRLHERLDRIEEAIQGNKSQS